MGCKASMPKADNRTIIMFGLTGVGKTTIVQKLNPSKPLASDPITEEYHENIIVNKIHFKLYDISGKKLMTTNQWDQDMLERPAGLIFVIDGSDKYHVFNAKQKLDQIMDVYKTDVPLLVLVNKSDLNGMKDSEIIEKMGLNSVKNRIWCVQSCCAVSGVGLNEGIEWLSKNSRTL